MSNYNVIRHYASEYYDPVKAHEYYEEHKKLKGRKSTAKLNETGKEAATNVKQNLDAERKAKVEESKTQMKNKTESRKEVYKAEVKQYSEETTNRIKRLREYLSHMSRTQKAARKKNIENQIEKLREENGKRREDAQNKYKGDVESYRNEHKTNVENLKTEYDKKYEDELEKIRSDSSMKAVSKSKSKKDSSSNVTKNPGYTNAQIRSKLNTYKKNKK